MPARGFRERQPLHEVVKLAGGGWPKHEVSVGRHQAVRQKATAGNVCLGFGNDIEKSLVIVVFVKDGKPTVATIEDVVDQTARRVSQGPAHDGILPERPLISTIKGS